LQGKGKKKTQTESTKIKEKQKRGTFIVFGKETNYINKLLKN
jgi:hypothetical protein